jgi:hypothetical protein
MNLELLQSFFGWCAVINVALIVVWFVVFTLAHDFVYKTHIIVYKISRASFDTIHYAGMGLYKLAIIVFNLVPYLVLELL